MYIIYTLTKTNKKQNGGSKMKKLITIILIAFIFTGCIETTTKQTSDNQIQKQSERIMVESNRQLGLPAINNFQEKKNLKWIYELCDQENLVCYAYFFNEREGKIGQYLGECVGYGIPYSTQYSNPDKLIDVEDYGIESYQSNDGMVISQAEPNGLFKPEGLSATWLIMIDPETKKPRPVYIEPAIIVSPFKLK